MQAGFPPAPTGGTGRKVVIGLLIFLVVALLFSGIGYAVWYFAFRDKEETVDDIDQEPEVEPDTDTEPDAEPDDEPDAEPIDYLGKYQVFNSHAIRGNNIKCIDDQTPTTCAQKCSEHETCNSFDFKKDNGQCCLSSKTRQTAGSAYYQNDDWDFYESKDVEPVNHLPKFLRFTNHAISGNNIKCMPDKNPSKCAEECIKTDNCRSFDFKKSNGECCLSTKTSKTAGSAFNPTTAWDFYELPLNQGNRNERILGQACNDVYKCVNGKCENGKCVDYEDPEPKGGTNFECQKDDDCGRGLSCSSTGQCKRKSGVACIRPDECASGTCINRKCQ